jgi:hypothetical protein
LPERSLFQDCRAGFGADKIGNPSFSAGKTGNFAVVKFFPNAFPDFVLTSHLTQPSTLFFLSFLAAFAQVVVKFGW